MSWRCIHNAHTAQSHTYVTQTLLTHTFKCTPETSAPPNRKCHTPYRAWYPLDYESALDCNKNNKNNNYNYNNNNNNNTQTTYTLYRKAALKTSFGIIIKTTLLVIVDVCVCVHAHNASIVQINSLLFFYIKLKILFPRILKGVLSACIHVCVWTCGYMCACMSTFRLLLSFIIQ